MYSGVLFNFMNRENSGVQSKIAVLNIGSDFKMTKSDISVLRQLLAERLNIQFDVLPVEGQQILSFTDLLNPSACLIALNDFSSRVDAVNLTCATSMFIKYWAVPLLFPYFYALTSEDIDLPWDLSCISTGLPPDWYWDRTLHLINLPQLQHGVSRKQQSFEGYVRFILDDLKKLFDALARTGKVQKFLLWENTALRILQFYDMMNRKGGNQALLSRIQYQRQFLLDLPAADLGLKQNPFYLLDQSRQQSSTTYQRKKCCFYFQLPEAQKEYCASCPLLRQDEHRGQYSCKSS